MRFVVVGGGAIGLLYAARLALSGCGVHVVTRTAQQAAMLAGEGIRFILDGREAVAAVEASSSERSGADVPAAQWVLLTVKQTSLDAAAADALSRLLMPGAGLICMQNGIGHVEMLQERLPHAQIYAAVTSEGALREDAGSVRMTGSGELHFGRAPQSFANRDIAGAEGSGKEAGNYELAPQAGDSEKMLLGALRKAGINAWLSNDMGNRIYRKLLINSVINPLTAIYDVENGRLPEHPSRLALMRGLHAEAEAVLIRAGMEPASDSWERLLEICMLTAPNISSMLGDVRGGRLTEVDWINGGVVRLARRLGMEAPLNEAVRRMVHALKPLN
ncbi:ketopantoate reductase family protein [Paenibacillus beijingensis]|uniref:2-dehydropantoate 2-reductase n=1 Tax=Paenibacillus beijingensis TaxID=1126833 RepID=A0A0D5NMG8_9BACL|nr:ketopantoate reductase family protein [Paenibacillus beijingensis]AJY76355.1 hypothetical protein VN24_19515 [Paenibacillus beijingensis]